MLASNAALILSGQKYRKELLAMPLVQFKAKLEPYVTIRYGVRGKESVGTLDTDAEIRPYVSEKGATDNTSIILRELETFMGDVVKEFDPRVLSNTVYGNLVATNPTETDIAKAVAFEMAKKASNKLYKACFQAKRKANGDKTMDLFNGFCTIATAEITAGTIASVHGNFKDLGQVDSTNAYDKITEFYSAASEELAEEETILYMSIEMKRAYEADYATLFNGSLYNKEYKRTFVQGSDDKCQIVALSALAGTGMMFLSTKENMLVGVDQLSDSETVKIRECDNPKMVQFFMVLYWGAQFESIDKARLLVGKYTAA